MNVCEFVNNKDKQCSRKCKNKLCAMHDQHVQRQKELKNVVKKEIKNDDIIHIIETEKTTKVKKFDNNIPKNDKVVLENEDNNEDLYNFICSIIDDRIHLYINELKTIEQTDKPIDNISIFNNKNLMLLFATSILPIVFKNLNLSSIYNTINALNNEKSDRTDGDNTPNAQTTAGTQKGDIQNATTSSNSSTNKISPIDNPIRF